MSWGSLPGPVSGRAGGVGWVLGRGVALRLWGGTVAPLGSTRRRTPPACQASGT